MRRFIILLLLLLSLTETALAQSTDEPLFPARGENGLFGYINAQAEWVIAPQFSGAGDFRGEYACCWMVPDGLTEEEQVHYSMTQDCEGIIDRTGAWVVPPEYSIDSGYDGYYYGGWDDGVWIVFGYTDPVADEWGEGFFDIPSGYFSGLQWGGVGHWCSDSRLIPVTDPETYLDGYADRSTGELIIPCRFGGTADPAQFHEGVAVVYECISPESDIPDMPVFSEWPILINEQGDVIPLPEGIHPADSAIASEGLVAVTNEQGVYGYADLSGNVIIEPQFYYADGFSEGLAMVMLEKTEKGFTDQTGKAGFIDRTGQVVLRGYHWPWYSFHNGCARVGIGTDWVYIDKQGNILPGAYMENGLAWHYETDEHGQYNGWAQLVDRSGTQIGPHWRLADFESRTFDEGRQPVQGEDRSWCYLDDTGAVVLPGPYGYAEPFHNGLAYVRIGSHVGYIDLEGNEVYFWEYDDPF